MRTAACAQAIISRSGCTIIDISMLPVIKAFLQVTVAGAYGSAFITAGLHTEQGRESVVGNIPVVLSGVGPGHRQAMIHALIGRSPGIIIIVGTEVIERREASVLTSVIYSAEY